MNSFLIFCGVFAIYILVNVLAITNHRKHPPFIEKGETGKKNPECYIVSVWTVGKGSAFYLDYKFVKRKNGKYRLKFYPVLEWIVGVAYLSLYIRFTDWDAILKYPKTLLPLDLVLFLAWLDILIILDNAPIVARIYFYKYMKKHVKGKRR